MRRFRLTPQLIGLAILVSSASVVLCSAQTTTPAATTPATTPTTNGGSNSAPASQPGATADQIKAATDDASQVEAAVATASSLLDDANKYQKTITAITTPAGSSGKAALDNLQELQTTVGAIAKTDARGKNSLIDKLSAAQKNLASAEDTRKTDCKVLTQPSSGSQPDITDAISKCKKAENDASATSDMFDPTTKGLQDALQTVSPYVGAQITSLQDKLKPLSDPKLTSTPPDAPTILQILPTGMPALKQVFESKGQYEGAWGGIQMALLSLSITPGTKDAAGRPAIDPDKAITDLKTALNGILLNLDRWFKAVADKMQAEAQSFDNLISGVLGDPAKNSATALDAVRTQGEDISSAQAIADAWPPLVGFLVDGQPDGFHLKATKGDLEAMQKWVNVARGAVSRVHDALAGDFSGFETDQVSLYYFTDVQRLMYALNEGFQTMGGVAEAQEEAKAQRKALTQTELELADAQATVNRYQKQVLDLQEQQRQAQAKLKGLNSNVSKLGNRLNNAQDSKNQADADYQQAQSDQAAAPTDPTKTTELNKAAAKQTAAATKLSQSQSDYNAAKSDQDKAQSQVDDSQNQSDSLPAKLAAAQQALSDAQTAVAAERRKMIMAAQTESDAFAFARDNTPFMVAFADASSSNPAKRVMLYAFNDSKTIFMRGKRDDLDEVKQIIAKFDLPAPQARLTLWTFQLSADSEQKTNKKAAKQLNESMEIIDQELGDTRARENTILARLRDLINEAVVGLANLPMPNPPYQVGHECDQLGAGFTSSDCEKFKRVIQFYDPAVLEQLNFGRLDLNPPDHLARLRKLIPDPAGTTTLGEALLVLSLARPVTKNCVRSKFESEIHERLRNLPVTKSSQAENGTRELLTLTWHALDIWEARDNSCAFVATELTSSTANLNSSQLEIVRALRAAYDSSVLNDIVGKIGSWAATSAELDATNRRIAELTDRGMALLPKPDADRLSTLQLNSGGLSHADAMDNARLTRKAINSLPAADRFAYDESDRERLALEVLIKNTQVSSQRLATKLGTYGIDASGMSQAVRSEKALNRLKLDVFNFPGLSTASPRVAAADEMLKELIIAVEDDLSREFVQPMITELRDRLTREKGVGVGVVQRESLLATNRGVARIDPRASAQLAVGDQEDILSGVQQLAQLYGAVQSGGALAALGALQQQPREPQPEIYALNTGNRFQVTPVFDPSGQALRFKFDFVATANVQEPNGTTNKQLSRIERHTVNTEVQLSNLETREISRFEVNARLGLPTTYWGGFPILKDIPHVRPWVPLIGWFVRKGGSNASAQQSVIFGQTTIYPTIGALINLVSDPGAGTVPNSNTDSQPTSPAVHN